MDNKILRLINQALNDKVGIDHYYFVTQREPATEESVIFTSWNIIRFFAVALNDKVYIDKKHMSLRRAFFATQGLPDE